MFFIIIIFSTRRLFNILDHKDLQTSSGEVLAIKPIPQKRRWDQFPRSSSSTFSTSWPSRWSAENRIGNRVNRPNKEVGPIAKLMSSIFSTSSPPSSRKQSVTNIFEYSNIRIYWSRIYVRTFVRINFSFQAPLTPPQVRSKRRRASSSRQCMRL